MKRSLFILCLLFFAGTGASAASFIVNGSFEADGPIGDIDTANPYGWEANIGSKFGGEITGDWNSQGDYSLWLYSYRNYIFAAGDNTKVSQQVDLTDANEIIFDLYLSGYKYTPVPWDGNKVTAFVSIDSNIIWQSDMNDNGVYYNVNVPVDGNLTGIRTLSIGVYSNVSERLTNSYWAMWDFAKFDALCGGFGHLESDLNRDCFVNFADVDVLAQNWLRTDLAPVDDLIDIWPDGTINLSDYAVLANQWMQCTDWQGTGCIDILEADLNFDGEVNFLDYNILVSNWGVPTEERADVDGSGTVDYKDLAIMSDQWLQSKLAL